MIIFFRSLHKLVVKFKEALWLLNALKQITSSNCYSMERECYLHLHYQFSKDIMKIAVLGFS